jgi:protein SCO1/2
LTPVEPTDRHGKPSGSSRRAILLAAGGVLAGLLFGWLTIQFATGNWRFGPYEYHGIVWPTAETVDDFTLTTQHSEETQLSDFREKFAVIYFGYTYCPDVCPTVLTTLSQALAEMKAADREQVQVVLVTVDPERDTPEVLADYLAHFDSSFVGLTGTADQIAQAAEAFGVYFNKGEGSAASGYVVDHTATVSVLDREGRLRLLFTFGTPAEDIAADLTQLLHES